MTTVAAARRNVARLAALLALAAIGAACGDRDPVVVWTQLGPDSQLVARAVVDGGCPEIVVDGVATAMRERAAPSDAFPVRTCEAEIAPGATSASVAGQRLALLANGGSRFAVVGDTGCRVQSPQFQACNDPAAWPAARVADSLSSAQPDLIVHVGDYLYRLGPCPVGDGSCAGPYGDNWETWFADFFSPFAQALGTAPWLFVRGNHELCDEGGDGWFRLLDPHPYAGCADYTQPWAVDAGGVRLVVLDSALASDTSVDPGQVEVYTRQLERVRALAAGAGEAWLLTHRPVWALGANKSPPPAIFADNPTLQAASGNDVGASTTLVLSGHLHVFSWYGFVPSAGRPPQVVAGSGGTLLDPPITGSLAGMEIAGAELATGATVAEHGFLAIEPGAAGWQLDFAPVAGDVRPSCVLAGRELSCDG